MCNCCEKIHPFEKCAGAHGHLSDCEKKELEAGKCFGECECCGMETILVEVVGLCGPCCWGEAETINGNW